MFPFLKALLFISLQVLIKLARFGHKLQIAGRNSDGGGEMTLVLLKLQLLSADATFLGKESSKIMNFKNVVDY